MGVLLISGVLFAYGGLGSGHLSIHGYLEALGYVAGLTAFLGLASGWISRSYRWGIGVPLATVLAGFLASGSHLSSWRASLAFLGGGILLGVLPALLAVWGRRRLDARRGRNPSRTPDLAMTSEAPLADDERPREERSKQEKA